MTENSTNAGARSVIVTGGNRGIGRAIVERFLAAGHKVASLDMGGEAPEGALGITCNVTDAAQVDAAFAEAEAANGPVEILVANAGITKDTLILRMSDADWDAVINVNLTGAFRCAKRATKSMIRGRWGRIIFTGSVVGLFGSAGQVNYSASKAALVGVARSLTREVGSRGVTANVVAPGFIETDMTAVLPEDVIARYLASIPANRLGQPAEVAATVAFLASEEAGFISGAVIPVDGGLGMGH
ncbi:MAG: 3-oxoacyl-ACP reductase FabG [Propionibacteriaceae bacterium]|nr:3-oxoacyl-ACP reductase FabG [Propionibacteriaceae bacterium]